MKCLRKFKPAGPIASVAALSLFLCGNAIAADLSQPEAELAFPPDERWEFSVAPYFWMAGLDGTIAQFGLDPVDVDLSFGDILENLDFAAMVVGEARRGRFGIFTDILYVDVSASGSGPLGVLTASLDNQIFAGTAMAEYRVFDQGMTSVDVMAGARIWAVNTDVAITGGPGAGLFLSDDASWVDPMIGVKARMQGSSPWFLTTWAMIGGFGVSSDIDWDVLAGVGYEVNDRFSAVAGYRAAGVDYQDGPFIFDAVLHGPILGGVLRF